MAMLTIRPESPPYAFPSTSSSANVSAYHHQPILDTSNISLTPQEYQYVIFRTKLLSIVQSFTPSWFKPRASPIISSQLYIADLYTATSPQVLDDLGITHILSVKSAYTLLPFGDDGSRGRFTHMVVSMEDTESEDLLSHLEASTAFIRSALSKNGANGSRVLVHCNLGNGPSAALVLGFLIGEQHMSYDAALEFLKERRSFVNINQGFERQLRKCEWMARRYLEGALFGKLEGWTRPSLTETEDEEP